MSLVIISQAGGHAARTDLIDPTDRRSVLRMQEPGRHHLAAFAGESVRLRVSESDLGVINDRHSSDKLNAGDVVIFERYACNDSLMRSPLKFTRGALDKFALDFEQGRGVHAQDKIPSAGHQEFRTLGRTFAADVVGATVRGVKANWLRVRFYCVTKGASGDRMQLIRDVQTGVLGYDSIGVMGGEWNFQEVEGPGGETLFYYEVDDNAGGHPRLEAIELSILSELGNVYGAGSDKGNGQLSAHSAAAIEDDADSYAGARIGDTPPSPYEESSKREDPYAGARIGDTPPSPYEESSKREDPYAGARE